MFLNCPEPKFSGYNPCEDIDEVSLRSGIGRLILLTFRMGKCRHLFFLITGDDLYDSFIRQYF